MKKILLSFLTFSCVCSFVSAQSIDDAKKFLYYEKITSAKQALQKLVASDPKNAQAIYWLGQTYVYNGQVDSAKIIYQNALNAGVNDAWIWIGSGHIESLQGGDINAAKQKFEQAITATTSTKGKNKGPNPEILTAIGRAMASGNSSDGDPDYGIEKLKQAATINPKDPDIFVNMGLCYLKKGGDHGGEAFDAFRQASVADPQYARAYYRIGKIYQTQRNIESMNEWYGKAIGADPAFAPVYLSYFQYYSEKDVTAAKEYLDKYVANADKDCATDFFVGDYLFRAGKYQESLQKAKEMDGGACKDYDRLNILYAYNYDRLGDSVQAQTYLKKYFSVADTASIQPSDYAFAGAVLAKFPESGDQAVAYLRKAILNDTIKENQSNYLKTAVEIAVRDKNYPMLIDLINEMQKITGSKLSETQYYNLSKAIVDGTDHSATATFDSVKYLEGASILKSYVSAYPDKPQPYSFLVRYAKASDLDTTRGLFVEPIAMQNEFLTKDTAAANKKSIFANYYYLLIYYAQYAKDMPKEEEYQKAIDVTEKMKALYSDPASEEYQFADKTGKSIQANLDKYNKSKPGGGASAGKSQK